jgi:hypothetical protein
MGAKIPTESGRGEIFRYRSPTQMIQPLKDPNLQSCLGQVRRNGRPVVSSSNNDRIVHFVSHFITSSLILLVLVQPH